MIAGTLGLVDVREDADARLVHADQIVPARRPLAHQAKLRRGRARRRRAGNRPAESGIFAVSGKVRMLQSRHDTHLHSYSIPLIEIIVLKYWCSLQSSTGVRSPSLHCSEPHWMFLDGEMERERARRKFEVRFAPACPRGLTVWPRCWSDDSWFRLGLQHGKNSCCHECCSWNRE